MASTTTSISIASRIEWCRQQSMHACSPRETTGWEAEEDGLWDALLNRDHSNQYQQGPPDVLARYVMGLQDGRAMMRMTTAYHQVEPRTRTGESEYLSANPEIPMRHISVRAAPCLR